MRGPNKIILFCLFISLFLVFQNYTLKGQFPRLNFKSFTEKEGLSKDYVRSICQDRQGFMWFGTPNGLDKFDGKNFINYNDLLKDTSSSNYQISYDILEDEDSIIWIATYSNGIIQFDKNRGIVTRLKHNTKDTASLGSNMALDVFEDKNENIWVATVGGGLNLWQKNKRGFKHFMHDPANSKSIGSNYISSISEDSKGNLWILSVDGIVSKFDPKTGVFENIILPTKNHSITLRRGVSQIIYVDSDDNVITGSFYGLYIIDSHSGNITHIPQLNPYYNVNFTVTSILEIQKGIIALATSFQGLYLFDIKTGEYVNYSNSAFADYYLNNTSITSIYKSRNGLIWLGSYYGGINMYNKEFSQFQLLSDNIKSGKELFSGIRGAAFCTAPDNTIWIASGYKEIIAYDPINKSARQVLKNINNSTVSCLFSNNNGEILVGTEASGLIIYDFYAKKVNILTNDPKDKNSIASNYILSVLQDKENKVWIGFTGSGLDLWDRSKNEISHFRHDPNNPNSLISDIIYRMIEDKNGTIWIGTQQGLCYFDKRTQSFVKFPLYLNKNLQINTILDIFEDSKGIIWVGTDRAIFRLNPNNKSSTVIKPKNEVPYLITNIMEDRNQNIWMTSFNKLFKLNPVNNDFSVYTFYNGSSTPSFLGYSSLSDNGQFYLGSLDRIITFDPSDIVEDTIKPKLFITRFEINNSPVESGFSSLLSNHINFTKSIKLSHYQSTFSFQFAALEFSFPEKIQYAYKLENYDKDWVYPGNLNNRASYTKVPPGKYVFRIMATNKRGDWYESVQSVTITIKPPFWITWWFRITVLLIVFVILIGIYSLRVRQLRRQKKKLERIVQKRTLDLHEANQSLSEQHEEMKQQNELLSQMSQQILNQKKELEEHYNKLEILVDERTKELYAAKNKAEESDKLKSAFLANMSHEIRTPMNAIVGFVNLLKEEKITSKEKDEFIEIINSNSDSLLILIDDILDLSMIEADQLIIRNEIFDINELLDHLYSSYSLLKKKHEVKLLLNNELHSLKLKINSDKIRIKQVVSNLLSNALKFTESGFVEFGLKMRENELVFYVKDTGIGIQEKDIDTIFERFRKSEEDNNTIVYRGAGLGLAISKALVNLMGGTLNVESISGKGSLFTFSLPASVISKDEPFKFTKTGNLNNLSVTNKNILVVEDEIANYMYLKRLLEKININVYHADNGLEALKMIDSGTQFHLVFMDIKMPRMDGYEATKIIKSKHIDLQIIAVTAFARPEERRKFMEAGFDEYIAKPVKPDELINIINKYL